MVRSAVEAWALAVGTAERPWYLWRCLRMVPGTAVSWFMTRGFVRDERRDDFDDQAFLVGQLGRALDACEAGFHEPAQAHAASIIDTALRAVFTAAPAKNWAYRSAVKDRLHNGDEWLKLPLRLVRLVPTSVALLNVLEEFWEHKGHSVPVTPNRHAAAHAVTPGQYNHANSLKFTMLATAILAEVENGGWARLLAHLEASKAA